MRKIFFLLTIMLVTATIACTKDNQGEDLPNGPRTEVPGEITGIWMFGKFSMTEYWSQNPADYLGNALEFAIAFKFESNGTYTQYFTSKSYMAGAVTYQQSVTQGTVEVDPQTKTIKTHPAKAHYKRTRSGQVLEERDMTGSELSSATSYQYQTGTEPSGAQALYLTLNGTTSPLTFLKQ